MTIQDTWCCPSCLAINPDAAYCNACGERRLTANDSTLKGLLHRWFETLLDVDGRVFRSCRELLTRPGELTRAHNEGRRRPYIGPFQLFLVMNLVFYITQGLTGLSILSIPLALHIEEWYAPIAGALLRVKLSISGITVADYAPQFDHKVGMIAKSLVIIMVPMLALCLAALLHRLRCFVPTHVVFATHFYGFMLLFLTLLFPASALILRLVGAFGIELQWSAVDGVISLIEVAAVAWYFAIAVPRVYGLHGWRNALASALLVAVVIVLLRVYRLVQFGATLVVT